VRPRFNTSEATKASKSPDELLIREDLPGLIHKIEKGHAALTSSENYLLQRMPNGFGNAPQLHPIADLSRRLGNRALDIAARQQMQLRGSVNF